MKRFIAIGSILFILAVTFWYFCLYASPLVISPETTYITAPLMPDGKRIDYFRAWEERAYPPEMKTDDNGYRILVRAIGDPTSHSEFVGNVFTSRDLDPELFRLQVYEKLGLDPTILPTLKLEFVETFLKRYAEEYPEEKILEQWIRHSGFWSLEDFPMLQDWLDENDAGIDLLSEAVRKPIFRAPEVRKSAGDAFAVRSVMLTFREFARVVQTRANYRIGIGDIDGAIEDIITGYLLARHVGKHGTLTDYLIGIAIEGMAYSIPIGANPEAQSSREQLQRLFDAIRSLPPSQKIEDCLEAERLFALAYLQEYAFGRKPDVYGVPEPGLWCYGVDWNTVFRTVNETYGSITAGREAEETIISEEYKKLLSWMEGKIDKPPVRLTVRGRTNVVLGVLAHVPAMEAAREPENRRKCAENMKLLTLALLLYEKDHGKLPDGDWRVAVRPYLDDNANGHSADKYFRCPSGSAADDETTYAMIRRESGVMPHAPYTLLLVEVFPPMKMTGNDGTLPEAKAVYWWRDGEQPAEGLGTYHVGGFNMSQRSGAVRFISTSASPAQWQSLMEGTSDAP